MNEDFYTINRMRAVTISREYGSGGGEIATRLAKRLGWQLIDHAIVERVASEIGTSTQEAEAHGEYTEGIVSRLLICTMCSICGSLRCMSRSFLSHLDAVACFSWDVGMLSGNNSRIMVPE